VRCGAHGGQPRRTSFRSSVHTLALTALLAAPGAFGAPASIALPGDRVFSNTLWVCSNDLSAIGVTVPSTESGSALKGFDLKTGEGKISAKLPGDHTTCNDIAIGADGSVYVTNTSASEILRLSPGANNGKSG
jgi:hypothetical protein